MWAISYGCSTIAFSKARIILTTSESSNIRMYWYRETEIGITWNVAQSLCEAMHPNMSLVELDQPGEETAIIDNYVKLAYPGGFTLQKYIFYIFLDISRDMSIADMFYQYKRYVLSPGPLHSSVKPDLTAIFFCMTIL